MRRMIGLIILLLMFALSVSAQESAMYKSDDGLLVFQHPAEWELGADEAYTVQFTLPDAEVTIQVIDEDSPEAFLEAQRKGSAGWVTEFAIGDFAAISSMLTSGAYQIAFALDDSHVVVGVIEAETSEIASGHEQAVVDALASLRFGAAGAGIESPVLNIPLPAGWENVSSQMQGDYFQFVLRPTSEGGGIYILIEILDLAARGLLERVQAEGVGALMSQLPAAGAEVEALTIGSYDLARAIGSNETSPRFTAYTLLVAEESWLVAITAAADTEIAVQATLLDVDAIVAALETGLSLDESALNAVLAPTIPGVEFFPNLDPTHQRTPVDYPQTPPVGGPHHPTWQTCGVYAAPIVNEHAVHSLEHGAVWITYQPDLPAAEVEALASLTRRSTHRILSPYPGIDSPIILSAWGYQLKLESSDDPRLMEFLLQYEQGQTTPELGATCNGGETRTAEEIGE